MRRFLSSLLVLTTVTAAGVLASAPAASASPWSSLTRTFTTTLPSGDVADVYHPVVPERLRRHLNDAFPVVAVLQGANVDKSRYSGLGRGLARQGFIAVIPNHVRAPGGPFPPGGLFSSPTVIPQVLAAVTAADADPQSPLYRVADTADLGVVGHSFGGAAGLFAAAGLCPPPICDGPYTRPAALRAGAFYGTNLATGGRPDLDTTGVAVALVQGTIDSVAPPVEAEITYRTLEQPRALITVAGANHYGITDVNNPPGAAPDPVAPILPQRRATTEVARWSGLWLRTHLEHDPLARWQIYRAAGTRDGVVDVRTD